MARPGRPHVARALLAPAGRADAIAIAVCVFLATLASLRLGRGYFLADDFVQLANFSLWRSRGTLWDEVAARFAGSIDGVNGFYRPLAFASFAANDLIAPGHAPSWLAVNLALHLANAALVGFIVFRLAGATSRAVTVAALAAALLFFVFSPGWEAALWIACRYDSLATFFTLATGALFLDGRRRAALAATICALLSKEAGAVAIIFVGVLAALPPAAGREAGSWIRRWLAAVAPWIVVGALYALLRWAIFGSATEVYRGVHPQLLAREHWATLWSSGSAWARQVFPGISGARGLVALSALALAGGLALAARRGRHALLALLAAVAMTVFALALLLPHFMGFETNGIGGRLFYQSAAFYAVAVGLAFFEGLAALQERPGFALALVAVVLMLLAANVAWGIEGAREYVRVQRSMRAAADAIAQVAARGDATGYELVIVPDAVGRVPFGRNAQAGLMLPPVQREALSARLLVQTDGEFDRIDRTIDSGMLSALRAVTLYDFMEGRAGAGPWPRLVPTRYLCWDAARRRMVPLAVRDAGAGTIGAALTRAYRESSCAMPPARP